MKVFITGASGYIGNKLAHTLASQGNSVHAFARSLNDQRLLHPNITIWKGDVRDKESISLAVRGCSRVFHTAGKVGVWSKDLFEFYEVNVKGTENVLIAAKEEGVEKLVFTSSGGVMGASFGEPVTEKDDNKIAYHMEYDHSKKIGEDLVLTAGKPGFETVVVNPSKVYGPGFYSHSFTSNSIIKRFLQSKFTLIPSPGSHKVCFAYIDDVVRGHILAMEKGGAGERYILGGVNISYYDFFNNIRLLAGSNARIIPVSKKIIKFWAGIQLWNHLYFDMYNTNTKTWSIGKLPFMIADAAIISVNNVVYVAGGYNDSGTLSQVWKLQW